ncbi:MAG: hypothetical protein M1831_005561 [Alyxoria varia]|nr:MAG: hypothetical protein M1831_005561 [Alyxoria varia]
MAGTSTSAALYAAITAPLSQSAVPEDAKDRKHHLQDGKGFRNPWDSYKDFTAPSILFAILKRRFSGKFNDPDTTPPTVPVHQPRFLPSRETSSLRATWLGHACFYVEFPGGFRALFDPVFTARCSPFSFMGPKRYTEMPCQIDDLPMIDAVFISHSHYDHLSHPTVMKIKEKFPQAHFFAPLGNKKWFTASGIQNMTEMDWWDSRDITLSSGFADDPGKDPRASSANEEPAVSATVGCLPCQHTSARTPFNKSQTLWSSWSVESGGKKVWFGGDTGYRRVPELPENVDDYSPELNLPHCPAFAEIGALRGPFDLGLIPIGAYAPRFIMSPMHANPFDSVNIFRDTRCKRALGIHWGTWVLTEEDVLEPPKLLKQALRKHGIAEEGAFDVCDIGESREFSP